MVMMARLDAELDSDRVKSRQIERDKGQKIPESQETPRITNSQNSIAPPRGLADDQSAAFEGRTNEIGYKDKPDISQSAIRGCRSFSHPHIVKLSLLFCGAGDHVRQAGMR